MKLPAHQKFERVKLAELTPCAPGMEDTLHTTPDGGCLWSTSHALRHGKFSDLNVARQLDAEEEALRAARGPTQPRRPVPAEETQALDERLAHERAQRQRVEAELRALQARSVPLYVHIPKNARAQRERWDAKTKRLVLVRVS